VLGKRHPRERRGSHALEPERPHEDDAEGDEERQEEKADPAVDDLRAQGAITT